MLVWIWPKNDYEFFLLRTVLPRPTTPTRQVHWRATWRPMVVVRSTIRRYPIKWLPIWKLEMRHLPISSFGRSLRRRTLDWGQRWRRPGRTWTPPGSSWTLPSRSTREHSHQMLKSKYYSNDCVQYKTCSAWSLSLVMTFVRRKSKMWENMGYSFLFVKSL